MIRSIVRAITLGSAVVGAALASQAASATAFTITFTNANSSAAAYNYLTLPGTGDGTLSVNVYGGHLNDTTVSGLNTVTASAVATWASYGLGVLYNKDAAGDGTHQIDNTGGGVDFVTLEFSEAVTLSTINRKAYGGKDVGTDTDASFMAYSGSLGSLLNGVDESKFTSLLSGVSSTGSTASSKIWLVAANVGTSDRNDAFKLTSLKVSTPTTTGAVPEPATWAMMLAGFGSVGAALRRRRKPGVAMFG